MPLVETLFPTPHRPLIRSLAPLMEQCDEVLAAVGFMTAAGVASLKRPLRRDPSRLTTLVVGLPTEKALAGLDALVATRTPLANLWIHLGKNKRRRSGSEALNYHRFHPMMHSKTFYFAMGGGKAVAIVGSHNLTQFALEGENCELAVRIEGPTDDPAIAGVHAHIMACKAEAAPYEPDRKALYGLYTVRSLEGMVQAAAAELEEEDDMRPTLVVLMAGLGSASPVAGEVVYFDLPQKLRVNTVGMEVHLYLLQEKPSSNEAALRLAQDCEQAWRCQTVSTGIAARTAEGSADWYVPDAAEPRLKRTPRPFRPTTTPERRQVFVRLERAMRNRYEYGFEAREQLRLTLEAESADLSTQGAWLRVLDVQGQRKQLGPAVEKALREVSPESQNYVLYANRRRGLREIEDYEQRSHDQQSLFGLELPEGPGPRRKRDP